MRAPVTRRTTSGWHVLGMAVLLAYPAVLLALTLLQVFAPARSGLLAITQVFAPYLFFPLLALVPFTFFRNSGPLRLALALCAVAYVARFMPPLNSPAPEDPSALHTDVMSWNIGEGGDEDVVAPVLAEKHAGIVALAEADWNWIKGNETVARAYPNRWGLTPRGTNEGLVFLSDYPMVATGTLDTPAGVWDVTRVAWARFNIKGNGRESHLTVVAAHPRPANSCGENRLLPRCYDSIERDAQIAALRAFVDSLIASGERVLMVGDFNTAEREPAYHDLAAGLTDVYASTGRGIGNTWHPGPFQRFGFGILRIDYMFASPNLKPLSSEADCMPTSSDHCMLTARIEVP